MSLSPGTCLGPYEVVSAIGAGGMGEVYRATDTKLKRQVAIKILPVAFARDHERLARFQREAEVLASLNHPNIAGIYGIEETDGSQALIMELIEGEDLSAPITRGPIALPDALPIARQIADALEAAHEQGIIHRDLKPANVKVRADGVVKVLDFGLAKAQSPAGTSAAMNLASSPTLTSPAMTEMGMILGTAAYMAPEQARGRAVDKRADIWAFGAVLYEMLTGTRAFRGDDLTETLAAVVKSEPDWSQIGTAVPAHVERVLRLCLQKDPKQRIGDIRDVRLALDGAFETNAPVAAASIVASARPLWRRAVPVLAAVIVTAALTGAAFWYARPATPTVPTVRFLISLADGEQLSSTGRQAVTISRDGTQIIYSANRRLYRRTLSAQDAQVIPGADPGGGLTNPVFSPDGRYVAFFSQRERSLKKIAVTGGVAQTLAPVTNPFGMSWSEDGIVLGQGGAGIIRIPETGGKPEQLVTVTPLQLAHGPQVLAGGRALLYTVAAGALWDQAHVVVRSLAPGGTPHVVIEAGADARYVPTGHLVYASSGTLLAVPFDLGQLKVTGPPVTVVEGVMRSIGGSTGTAQFAVSDTGSLIYVPGPVAGSTAERLRVLAVLNRRGGFERMPVPPRSYAFPRVSPDGTRVAVSTEASTGSQIWILDLAGTSGHRQLTTDGTNSYPVWSPDGQRVAFQSTRDGDNAIFWQRADGAGVADRLTKPEAGVVHIPDSWSPDGQHLAFTRVAQVRDGSLWILSIKDKATTAFAEKPSSLIARAAFSPDGKWLAYQSDETGQNSIFVQPFPATGAKYLVTRGGHPFWSPDGRELVINPAAGQIMTVAITTQPSFSFGPPVSLPGGLAELASKDPSLDPRMWDYTPDGKRIIGVADGSTTGPAVFAGSNQIQVVVNWFEELTRRVKER